VAERCSRESFNRDAPNRRCRDNMKSPALPRRALRMLVGVPRGPTDASHNAQRHWRAAVRYWRAKLYHAADCREDLVGFALLVRRELVVELCKRWLHILQRFDPAFHRG
jgi:hypothetical protein